MKKIVVEKNEGIAEVIDRMIATSDEAISLVIPGGSLLAKSVSNFRLLKRDAGLAGKSIVIDSSDDEVLHLAKAHGIATAEAVEVSDIVAQDLEDGEDGERPSLPPRHGKKAAGIRLTVRAEDDDGGDVEVEDAAASVRDEDHKSMLARERFFKPRAASPAVADADRGGRGRRHSDDDDDASENGSGKKWMWIVGVVVVLVAIFYGATVIFGRAQVTINFTQTPWTYQNNFIAEKSVATTTPDANDGGSGSATIIPAQVFTTSKNVTQLFAATGPSVSGGIKAQGTITIYNDYGAAPQDLVATTRFVTPDGKLFRLVNDVTVPGATVAGNGTITPSSIDAPIIADQTGASYNVGPVAKLTVPGFEKNAGKYAGFYGQIKGQTTGGASGSHPTPTSADIAQAKASTTAILQADLQSGLTASYPNNFKILDGATSVQISSLTVNTSTDANGNFSVFGQATLTAIGFDESALAQYLLSLGQAQANAANGSNGGSTPPTVLAFKNFSEPNYSAVQASFTKGQVSFSLSANEILEPAFSASQFASQLSGKGIAAARDMIQNLPELSDGKISVWPIWLWSMPGNPDKIQVTVN